LLAVLLLLPVVGCDEDVDDPGDTITYDDYLLGTWYRYSFIEDGLGNDYIPGTLVFSEDGELDQTEVVLGDMTVDEEVTEYDWRIVNGEYRQYLREDNSLQFQGEYTFNVDSSGVTFTADSGYVDVYVKGSTGIDTTVFGSWDMVLMTVDGENQDIGYSPTHNFNMNGSVTYDGSSTVSSWFVNGEYLVIRSSDEILFYDTVTKYQLTSEDTRLSLLFNRIWSVDGEFVVQNVAMVFERQ